MLLDPVPGQFWPRLLTMKMAGGSVCVVILALVLVNPS